MSRPRWIAVGALALLLAVAPFVPRGGDDDHGAITPSGQQEYDARSAATAGLGRLTPAARGEIDRVLAEGGSARRAAGAARCAMFEGQRYCLGTGWTEASAEEIGARETASASARRRPVEQTGDLDTAVGAPAARTAAQDRAELTAAARSVAKVWLLRHELQGVPLPTGFLDAHPEARTTSTGTSTSTSTSTARTKTAADYPARAAIMDPKQVADQTRTYWCGPTAMQMIGWGWKGKAFSQAEWARRLGTTTDGTAISEMVRVVNGSTGWDRKDHAGPYVVLDIGDWSFTEWTTLLMRHVSDYRAPVVLHPILQKRFYPYLDDDASGHFQVGRGYSQKAGKPVRVSYFEPWNQQRFDPSEPSIGRVQWRNAYKSYRANLAHPHRNIGV